MTYELWDLTSRNMIDWFEAPGDALDAVRAYLEAGEASLVALIVRDASGAITTSATGFALAEWAATLEDQIRHSV